MNEELNKNKVDIARIDFLQKIMIDGGKYTGKCNLRLSRNNRGFRLHESLSPTAKPNVRDVIDNVMQLKK